MGVIRNARRLLRQAKRALNGKALSELDAVMQSRFSDLESRLDSGWLDPFPLHHSSLKIRSAPRHNGDAICVASAMPPDKTGFASVSLLSFWVVSFGVVFFVFFVC